MTSPLAQAIAFQNANSPAQTGIAPTDVVGSYKLASDAAEKNYAAKLAASNAMWGGLAGLGGAGITALGPTFAKSYFGQGAATAAAPAASAASTAGTAGLGAIDATAPLAYSGLPAGFDAAAAAAPTIAADIGSVAAPTVATDLAAAAAPEVATAAATMPEWLSALIAAAAAIV